MIPARFEYLRPQTLAEAVELLAARGEEAKLLTGGHSLIPAMKLRFAQPKVLIDLGRIPDLRYIEERDGAIAIGALVTHSAIESSELLRDRCSLLPEVAAVIGDVQIRNRGTLAGSAVHADPAADWPAALLALEAKLVALGPRGRRTIQAKDFFVNLMQTALASGEILVEIQVEPTPRSVAYVKTFQKASGFAVAGVAAVLRENPRQVRLGVTGVAAKPFRATATESFLSRGDYSDQRIEAASGRVTEGVEALSDIHASAEYRLHLAALNARRALQQARERLG